MDKAKLSAKAKQQKRADNGKFSKGGGKSVNPQSKRAKMMAAARAPGGAIAGSAAARYFSKVAAQRRAANAAKGTRR